MMPCGNRQCFLCQSIKSKSSSVVIEFSDKQIHRFINGYQAILNCSANCDTSNIIYALTCPCGEHDYIGSTAKSLSDRICEHREEGHRIIREFLIGPQNMTTIFNQDKRKAEPLRNQYDLLLYQHSARCSSGLQRFLGKNPSYWCFIPQLSQDVKVDNDIYFAAKKNKSTTYIYPTTVNPFGDMTIPTEQSSASSSSRKPMFFAAFVVDLTRTKEETQQLVRHLPDPPQWL